MTADDMRIKAMSGAFRGLGSRTISVSTTASTAINVPSNAKMAGFFCDTACLVLFGTSPVPADFSSNVTAATWIPANTWAPLEANGAQLSAVLEAGASSTTLYVTWMAPVSGA